MTAAAAKAALARAEAMGARFRLAEGGRVRFAAGAVPAEVVAELRAHRAEVAAILAARSAPPGDHDAAEAAAMVAHPHHAAPASPSLATPDFFAKGLLRSFRDHARPAGVAPPGQDAASGVERSTST